MNYFKGSLQESSMIFGRYERPVRYEVLDHELVFLH